MTAKNDVLEKENKETGLPSQEEVMMTQEELINGLLAASDFDKDENLITPVEIRRAGQLFFNFHVTPLSEKELMRLRKLSCPKFKSKTVKNHFEYGDPRLDEFRSRKIYAATTPEDRAKLWDNPQAKAGLIAKGKTIMESWEIIDAVLMAGEKSKVAELIDKISGFTDDEPLELEEYAKNS